jgi:hypothetical protein
MPWGLMDGLAVTVVPKERAGMATGIFNTARVAGEGVALAIVSAVLAALAHTGLRAMLSRDAAIPTANLSEAAQRIATGDIANAAALLPQVGRGVLVSAYADAFQFLVHILTGITLLAALAAFGLLSKGPAAQVDDDAGEEDQRRSA